jgi:hypothetical protein
MYPAGEFTPGKYGEWRFDKRTWGGKPITRKLGDPPKNMKNDLVRALINSFNEATDAIPCWDKYAETAQVSCSHNTAAISAAATVVSAGECSRVQQ